MRFKSKYICKYAVILLLLFLIVGYILSDSRFFENIIIQQNINSPKLAFEYVLHHTEPVQTPSNTIHGLTPKYLLTIRKHLWCDEGAILFLTFAHKLGYKTRLVDLLDENKISRHTIAEVFEHGRWVTYDYTNKLINAPYQDCVKFSKPIIRVRKYPKTYNFVVQNNFFLQRIALKLRSISEPLIPDFTTNTRL